MHTRWEPRGDYARYLAGRGGQPMRRALIKAQDRYTALKRQHLGIGRTRQAYRKRRR